jgi:hypothetical protein
MKNKNNKTANELVDLIITLKQKEGIGRDFAYAFATGVLISLIDWARTSSNKNTLQNEINNNYKYYSDALMVLEDEGVQA